MRLARRVTYSSATVLEISGSTACVERKSSTVDSSYRMCAMTVYDNYRVRQKSSSLKFFAVFSATVRNFNLKFYRFIYDNLLNLTA